MTHAEAEVKKALAKMIAEKQNEAILVEAMYLFGVQMFAVGEVSGMRQIQYGEERMDMAHEAKTIIEPLLGLVTGGKSK